jgi:hypothetical protein
LGPTAAAPILAGMSARLRSAVRALELCAAAAVLPVGLAAAAGEPRSAARLAAGAPSRLQVTQAEYRLRLSSAVVRAGTVELIQLDAGREQHDLRLRREAGGPTIDGRLLAPGRSWQGTVRLRPGVYTLWCSLPEHARLGMRTTLRVTG